MRNRIVLILGLIILISACKIQSIKDIDFSKGDYNLYFIDQLYLAEFSDSLNKCEFQEKHHIFKIDNVSLLKSIQEDYLETTDKDVTPNETRCFYGLQLIKSKKLEWGGFIDWSNKILKNSFEKYSINIEKLESDSLNFKLVPTYKVKIMELQVARDLYNLLVEKRAFLYAIQFQKENPLFEYNWEFELKTDTSKLSMKRKGEEIEKEILDDLKELGKIQISKIHSEYKMPEIQITIHSEKNIDNSIPDKYKIVKPFSPIKNIEYYVLDIEEQKLKELIEKNGLKGITYEKM